MKKLIALLLAMIMVCGLATTAFADDEFVNNPNQEPFTPDVGTTFTKQYIVENGTSPAEVFDFGEATLIKFIDQDKVVATTLPTTYPAVTLGDATFESKAAGTYTATASVTIDEDSVKASALGIYTYEIKEVAGTTAGVNYDAKPVYLVVTVLRDETNAWHYVAAIHYETAEGAKTAQTTNKYEAGQLTISKEIIGNMADMTNKFDFEVVFTPETSAYVKDEAGNYVSTGFEDVQIVAADGTTIKNRVENADGTVTVTFELGDGASATLINIPDGTSYIVKETNLEGYTQTKAEGNEKTTAENGEGNTAVTGTIKNGDTDTAAFENELKSDVDTGVALDSAPYIVMLVVAMVGVVALVAKKRYEV